MAGKRKTVAGLLLQHYLVHCYCYYVLNRTLLTDGEFDDLAHQLRDRWDEIGEHQHKHLVSIDSLRESTSGYYIKDWPGLVKGCAEMLVASQPNPEVVT